MEEEKPISRVEEIEMVLRPGPSDIGLGQESAYSKNHPPYKASISAALPQNIGIDRESIIEHYRVLRQQQKDILSRINMKEDLKREIFGFADSFYCSNEAEKINLVSVQDPFAGRLILTEDIWRQRDAAKQEKRKKEHEDRSTLKKQTLLEPQHKSPKQPPRTPGHLKRSENPSGPRPPTDKKKQNSSAANTSNVEKGLLAYMAAYQKPENPQMQMEEIGEELFENKKSRISSIRDEDDGKDGLDSGEYLVNRKPRKL